jgi:hypothetical protein
VVLTPCSGVWLSYLKAIVAAFGLDERTVARWQKRSWFSVPASARAPGGSRQRGAFAGSQADELRVRVVGGILCGWLQRWRSEAACGSAAS